MEMTFIVKRADEPTLGLPEEAIKALHLEEGQPITLPLPDSLHHHIHPEAIEDFLTLMGVFEGDAGYDKAVSDLEEAWSAWEHRSNENGS